MLLTLTNGLMSCTMDVWNASFDDVGWMQAIMPIRYGRVRTLHLSYSTLIIFSLHLSKPVNNIWSCIIWQHLTYPDFMYRCVVINQPSTTRKLASSKSIGRHPVVFSLCHFGRPLPDFLTCLSAAVQPYFNNNIFQAIAINSSVVIGWDADAFIVRLGHMTTSISGECHEAE